MFNSAIITKTEIPRETNEVRAMYVPNRTPMCSFSSENRSQIICRIRLSLMHDQTLPVKVDYLSTDGPS